MAQNNYVTQWRKIDSLIVKKQLPRSALAEVKKLYAIAKEEGAETQRIKALVYLIDLQQEVRENNLVLSIKEIEAEKIQSKQPYTSVFSSLLAGLYWRYFQDHRWELYERKKTSSPSDDITTWDVSAFHKKIGGLYLASVADERLLQQIPVEEFRAIIVKGNASKLRPTLYDLLVFKAIDYFSNDEAEITNAALHFEIDDPKASAPVDQFIATKFESGDSTSLQLKALQLYQDVLSFHQQDKNKEALLDADIARIEFVYRNATNNDNEDLYKAALKNLMTLYSSNPSVKQAHYLLALRYNEKGNEYKSLEDTTNRFAKKEAVNILRQVVYDSTEKNEGWTNAYNLLKEIETPALSFEMEKVSLPEEPSRVKVTYKNVPAVFLKLVPYTAALRKVWEGSGDEDEWKALLKAKALKIWTQALPVTNDYQEHSVEIKVDGLPVGDYLLLASTTENFKMKSSAMAAQNFCVSNISYIQRENKLFVLHRKTGAPLQGAKVSVFERDLNAKLRRYVRTVSKNYVSDSRGYFEAQPKSGNNYYYLEIHHGNDRLLPDEDFYLSKAYKPTADTKTITRAFFFTDRSIYRPGQKVQFKAIVLNKNNDNYFIAAKQKGTINLFDANNQKIDSLTLTANDHGSIAGEFTLPANLLNGYFRIGYGNDPYTNATTFSVEEYKRPKFNVAFDKIKAAYKVFDTIGVKGNAKAFAGNTIGSAKVSYRVTRHNRFYYFTKRWLPDNSSQIKTGETTTADDGSFAISFAAIPDKKIDTALKPVFEYEVFAEVTDGNGETHSSMQWVSVGYSSIILNVTTPERQPVDSFKQLTVTTTNLNGESITAKATINIHRLSPEKRLIRKRLWERPDQFILSKQDFISLFPHDEYDNETDKETWAKTLVQTSSDTTSAEGDFLLKGIKKLPAGYYAVEVIVNDEGGEEIKQVSYVELYDPQQLKPNAPEYLWVSEDFKSLEPGDTKQIRLSSSADDVYLISLATKPVNGKPAEKISTDTLSSGARQFSFLADEESRGGYAVGFVFVKDNRVYQHSSYITIPWTNKELKVEFASFRNKTEPGAKETVKLKISGWKEEKVHAEMLASMYDASLDEFRNHIWSEPNIYPGYQSSITWEDESFKSIEADEKELESDRKYFGKRYDELIVFEKTTQPLWWINPLDYAYMDVKDINKSTARGYFENYSFQHDMNPDVRYKGARGEELAYGFSTAQYRQLAKPVTYGNAVAMEYDPYDVDIKLDSQKGQNIQTRRNLSETAFFFPFLTTNDNGDVEFSFTAPEALTKWKLQTFAHTKDLRFGTAVKELLTQKSLMVQPNAPRFVRQGDAFILQSKLANLSDKELKGEAQLQLFDAATMQPVDELLANKRAVVDFKIAAGGSAVVNFPITIPADFTSSLTWRITAIAQADKQNSFSDGEEASLPVLPSQILVTESLPVVLKGNTTKEVTLPKLLASANNSTLKNASLTVEVTTNPAWYVVQALPYLMEFPYECAEQTWNRYYANALAEMLATSSPKIQQVFNKWKTDSTALKSSLQKNEELKSVLLQETPWVLEAQSEAEQKQKIAILFDKNQTTTERSKTLARLQKMQRDDGSFPWFSGGPDSRYITQYILAGIGRLLKIKGVDRQNAAGLSYVVERGLGYADGQLVKEYNRMMKAKLKGVELSPDAIQYLYLRSLFNNRDFSSEATPAYNYFKTMAAKTWQQQTKQLQAMIALALYRSGDVKTSTAILASLKESAIISEELGMYWKDLESAGWGWQQAPVETVALLIEAFADAGKDTKAVGDLQTWLIQHKQTSHWPSTKATADACYAVLMQNSNLLASSAQVEISLGKGGDAMRLVSDKQNGEVGAGYFKQVISGVTIKPTMGTITVKAVNKTNAAPVWANIYWRYFENMDKVTAAATPLTITKQLYTERNSDRGPELVAVAAGTALKVGDKVVSRLLVKVDRDMEFVHLKDLRAAGFEPINIFSGYRWQNGTGYYEETKDASTNFFFDLLPKGDYVFDYPVYVAQSGNFSNGIATIQCMYAPQFSAHSQGLKVEVK